MARDRLGGWCLIAGGIMGIVTMAFHPTGADRAALGVAVHALALATVPIILYGGFALTRRLATAGALPELALVFLGVTSVASLIAASASGLLAPDLFARTASLEGDGLAAANEIIRYNHSINQSFARLLVAFAAAAIGLWSVVIVRTGLMRRGAGIFGVAFAVTALIAVLSGRLPLDVHGFGAFVLAQAVWLVLVGTELRTPPTDR